VLLDFCRDYYSDNKTELDNIECFKDKYEDIKAIVWYTNNSFVHKLLNKAFRTHDHERLLAFQFYIKDLRQQLYEAYDHMREKADKKCLTVYRGVMLHSSELENLKKNVGNLISMNGFLSTTLDHKVALIYAGLGTTEGWMPDYQSCLFEIEVDYKHGDTVFADISDSSLYPHEKEVLFMAGSIFQISNIEYNKNQSLWTILLHGASGAKDIVHKHLKLAKTELKQSNNILLFAKLMYYLDEFSKFDVYFKAVSNILPEEQADIMHLLFETALAYEKKGKTIDALNNYNQLLDKQLNNSSVASTIYSIAQLHYEQGNNSLALSYFAKALEIQSKCFSIGHPVLMQTLNQITQIGYNISKMNDFYQHIPPLSSVNLIWKCVLSCRSDLSELFPLVNNFVDMLKQLSDPTDLLRREQCIQKI
jgi:tetratricopeptide (TPR) repeat protein